MSEQMIIRPPLSDGMVTNLSAGDHVLISGIIYTARDAAHKRLVEQIRANLPLPIALEGQIIYYVGPTPPAPGRLIGAAGPTTSYRMDPYTPMLIELGLKGMIGKGPRGKAVLEAMRLHRAVYLAATGGAGALISKTIKRVEVVAYRDLGTEAIRRLEVEEFPAIVVGDVHGGDLYQDGRLKYRRTQT